MTGVNVNVPRVFQWMPLGEGFDHQAVQAVVPVVQALPPLNPAPPEQLPRRVAQANATGLLMSVLDETQRQDFKVRGWIFVTAKSGRRFMLCPGQTWVVDDMGKKKFWWCVYPNPYVANGKMLPHIDWMIGVLLHLRHNDRDVETIANTMPAAQI